LLIIKKDWSDWIGLSSVLRPRQHIIGCMGDGFTGQKTQPLATNSIKVLKVHIVHRQSNIQ